ncbi:hypothetical protein [Massilia phosphatilytica]
MKTSKRPFPRHAHIPDPTTWKEKDPAIVPLRVQVALRDAMRLEGALCSPNMTASPLDCCAGINWRCRRAQSSLDSAWPVSALRAQYALNPKGEKSFGDPVEECRGGIRYVIGRYHSANAAKIFWQQHHWY